ncbi:hypothetical protein JOD24_002728 [Kroppenstedtia sanguinis]
MRLRPTPKPSKRAYLILESMEIRMGSLDDPLVKFPTLSYRISDPRQLSAGLHQEKKSATSGGGLRYCSFVFEEDGGSFDGLDSSTRSYHPLPTGR